MEPDPVVESDTDIGGDIERDAAHLEDNLAGAIDITGDVPGGDDQQQVAPVDATAEAPSTSAAVSTFPFPDGPKDRSMLPTYGSHFAKSL